MKALDNFYNSLQEPNKGAMIALREIILAQDEHITPEWKYNTPFFYYKGKMFCYIWIHKKFKQPYIAFVEGKQFDEPFLLQEDRKRIKIMLIDAEADMPIKILQKLIKKGLALYKNGIIKIK
jgi:hypothetical protein